MWWGRFEMCFGTWCSSNRGAYFHINNLSTMQVKFSIVSCVFGGSYQIALLCDPCWKSTLKLLACTSRFSMKSMHGRLTQLTWQLKFFKFRVVHDRYWSSLFFQNRVMIHERSVQVIQGQISVNYSSLENPYFSFMSLPIQPPAGVVES